MADAGARARTPGPLRVLRLCSVFEPAELAPGSAGYDPVGGMQNHTAELTRCLDRLGVRQVVLTSRLAAPAGRTRFGARAVVIRTGVAMPVLRQAWAPLALPYALGSRGADVVHVHCGEDLAALPLALLAGARHGCPVVVTLHLSVAHGLRVTSVRSALLRAAGGTIERALLPAAAAVIALTPSTARLLHRDGLPPGRVHVIPPGYDPALFAGRRPDPFPAVPRPRVAYLGRLAPQKQVGTLIDAFGRIAAGAHLIVVGDGPCRPALQREASRLAARHGARFGAAVHFAGFVPHTLVPAVLQHIDVLVLPSRYEDLPSVLIEAMAAGVPVVASRVGGTADLVQHDVNGLLVPSREPAELAAAISRLLRHPAQARRLAEAARRTAQAYTWPVLARRVLDVYRNAVQPGARSQ